MRPFPDPSACNVLIFAPRGRDALVAGALLQEAGIGWTVCADFVAFQNALDEEACFAVVTEEAMRSVDFQSVASRLSAQPAWSDFQLIILTHRGGGPERDQGTARLAELLGNVTFLERPFHPSTFISVARTAFRGRQRQYEARTLIEELHESEERLRTALLAGRLGSWELDLTTWTLTASPTFKMLLGRTAEEPLSYEDWIASIHPNDRASMQKAMRATVEAEIDYAIECRHVSADGSTHWTDSRARLVRNRGQGRSRLVGLMSDVTGRKTAEETWRHLNEMLEQRVAERTAELKQAHDTVLAEMRQRERAEEHLRQVQKMEMIGQLTGGVAHDFNNLLMAVLVNLELLRKQVSDEPRAVRLIDSALQGAERGVALTQRLLAFARRQELKVEPTSLVDLIRGMSDLIERSIGSHIELRMSLPTALPPALVDGNQIELALLNLVVNARDAMPEGGVLTIEVDQAQAGAESELPIGSYVRLSVSDTGHGMNAETLRRATEPFFSTKALGKGTGLGLSMIQGLAVQLNGGLRLTSQVGRGTKAEVWLPVTTVAPEAKAVEQVRQEAASKITILIVDDDALIAMATVDMLEDLGHEVIDACTGDRALEILRNNEAVDLLITDYAMPRMNGAELAKAAREVRPDLPILLATGYAETPRSSGIDLPQIGKPYQQAQLTAAITNILSLKAAPQVPP